MTSHKYWIQFRLQIGQNIANGEIEIGRFMPICSGADLVEIAQVIMSRLIAEKKLQPDQATISVVAWTKFEQTIILAKSLEQH